MVNPQMHDAVVPPAAVPRTESLKDRFLDPRTLASFAILAILLALVFTHVNFNYGQTIKAIGQTNPLLYALAFVVFYFSFVVRAVRWRLLLRNAGEEAQAPTLFRIVILAWFANCILPAKMGDFYRAYLLRQRTTLSGSMGLGTILSERIIDFLVLMTLLMISGLISFRLALPHQFFIAYLAGIIIALVLIGAVVTLRLTHGHLERLLPERLRERVGRVRGGVLDAFRGRLPLILGLSVLVWAAESSRLYLVIQALPLHVALNPAQVTFIALVASLLTTIPALPGGLVLVEGGIIGVLVFFGFSASEGLSVAILDRIISYWSLIAIGLVVFLFTRRR